jgi:glycine/D-amino acid oxidase-like deaminating enzyme
MPIAILGAGIIGVSTAYYLSQTTTTLFACASGYTAGFLAKDWFHPSAASLGALSFDLHGRLAAEHGGRERWGYSRSTGVSLARTEEAGVEKGHEWLNAGQSRAAVAAKH